MFFRSFNNKVNGAGRALKKLECGTKINTLSFEQRLKELELKNVNLEKKINGLEKEIQDHKVKHQGMINLIKFSLGRYSFLEDNLSASEPSSNNVSDNISNI